jgi:hypothetical protein
MTTSASVRILPRWSCRNCASACADYCCRNAIFHAAADLQCQSHLRIDVSCIGAQRRERHAEETNSFAHRKLRRE